MTSTCRLTDTSSVPTRSHRSVRTQSGGMARIHGEIGPLLRRELHSVQRKAACDSAHRRWTGTSPKKLDELTVTQLDDLASKHYNPKPSLIVKHSDFNCRSQEEGETIAEYVAELHKIAEHCDYGEVQSDMLQDRLVCGTNKAIQRRLFVKG